MIDWIYMKCHNLVCCTYYCHFPCYGFQFIYHLVKVPMHAFSFNLIINDLIKFSPCSIFCMLVLFLWFVFYLGKILTLFCDLPFTSIKIMFSFCDLSLTLVKFSRPFTIHLALGSLVHFYPLNPLKASSLLVHTILAWNFIHK